MAYISAEKTHEFRKQIKAEFPGWKFSITNEHHSTICVAIIEAPIQMLEEGKTEETVNVYWIKDHYQDKPDVRDALLKIYEICYQGNHNNSDLMTDYSDVGWYIDISIGKWNKPFKYVPVEEKRTAEAVEVPANTVQVIEYSEKAIAVIGETYPIREKLKELGGKFNKFLSCGAGWIFPKTKLHELQNALSN